MKKKKIIETHVVKFPKAPEETRPSKLFGKPKRKEKMQNEENGNSGNDCSNGPGPGSDGLGKF
ncbi:hypothetical protein [Neomoorella humiferrea]|uniref:hypothetical protein n=1 Tax=Neomoorella humiferrea TaxID=676965 RepID=UPI0030D086DA